MKKHVAVMALLLATATVALAGPKLVSSYKNPKYSGKPLTNILVIGMNGRAEGRADFEDNMALQLARPGIQAVPSYTLLPRPEATPIDMNELKGVIREHKFDAVVVGRMVRVSKKVTEVPPVSYYGFYGYYSAFAPIMYDTGYIQIDTTVQIETNVYSIGDGEGELAWTCTSNSINPTDRLKSIKQVVKLILENLEKSNMIPPRG
jgi:hypothetical protein